MVNISVMAIPAAMAAVIMAVAVIMAMTERRNSSNRPCSESMAMALIRTLSHRVKLWAEFGATQGKLRCDPISHAFAWVELSTQQIQVAFFGHLARASSGS
jgi:hypothetical protein